MAEVARPILRRLCQDLLTPVGLTTPIGRETVIQVSMDYEAPLALNRLPEGTCYPVSYGASGHLFLAHCGKELRETMIVEAAQAPSAQRLTFRRMPDDAELQDIREKGYALNTGEDPRTGEGVIAVPVHWRGGYVASVHLRFMNRVLSPKAAVERFVPRMQAAAAEIGQTLEARAADTNRLFDGLNEPLMLAGDKPGTVAH